MKENAREVLIHDNEKEKMLRPHALLCVHASGDIPFSFTMVRARTLRARKTIVIFIIMLQRLLFLNGCPTSTTTKECSPDNKGVHKVYKSTGGFILARVNHV